MPKDPAVLFYTSDFLTGCALMSMAQRGKYITLLCLQHQQGHLSEEDMLDVCGAHDPKIWKKFKQDEDGLYFNERMDKEQNKRQNYSLSRSENGKKGGRPKKHMESEGEAYENHMLTICKAYEKHSENENENIDKSIFPFSLNTPSYKNTERVSLDTSSVKDKETDINIYKEFTAPSLEEVRAYCEERGNNVDPEHFMNYYESNGWKVGKNPMYDWRATVRSWENNGISNEKPKQKGVSGENLSFDPDEFMNANIARTKKLMEVAKNEDNSMSAHY